MVAWRLRSVPSQASGNLAPARLPTHPQERAYGTGTVQCRSGTETSMYFLRSSTTRLA